MAPTSLYHIYGSSPSKPTPACLPPSPSQQGATQPMAVSHPPLEHVYTVWLLSPCGRIDAVMNEKWPYSTVSDTKECLVLKFFEFWESSLRYQVMTMGEPQASLSLLFSLPGYYQR